MSLKSKKLEDLRVLEIGDSSHFQTLLPGQTDRIECSPFKAGKKEVPGISSFSPAVALRLYREVRADKYDLIVLSPLALNLWRPTRWWGRNLFEIIKRLLFNFELFGVYWVLWIKRPETPAIVLDMSDTMIIAPQNFWMFPLLRAYFKRELPQNNWHVFLYTTPKNEDVSNIRRQEKFQAAMAKIRPFPVSFQREPLDPAHIPEKEFDVFYVGDNLKTTVRMRGVEVLRRLAARGYRIDLPSERITREDFARRCERAWLVWSPEGSGWDCERHYESLVHGAVPVMNYPTIERYCPFIDTEHCFYHGTEGDDLLRVLESALQDKERLKRMIHSGREHLNRHYGSGALVDYLLLETERPGPDPARIF